MERSLGCNEAGRGCLSGGPKENYRIHKYIVSAQAVTKKILHFGSKKLFS
jgi:hypothetical protein